MERRAALKLIFSGGVAALASCSPIGRRLLEATPSTTPRPRNTSTPAPAITRTSTDVVTSPSEIAPTQTQEISDMDKANLQQILEKKGGETVSFKNLQVFAIFKLPRPGPDAIFGFVRLPRTDGGNEYAVVENFDCELEALQEGGKIGEPVDIPNVPIGSGTWKVEDNPISELNAELVVEYAAGVPIWLESESFVLEGETEKIVCPKTYSLPKSVSEGVREAVSPVVKRVIEYVEGNN